MFSFGFAFNIISFIVQLKGDVHGNFSTLIFTNENYVVLEFFLIM